MVSQDISFSIFFFFNNINDVDCIYSILISDLLTGGTGESHQKALHVRQQAATQSCAVSSEQLGKLIYSV